MMKKTNRILCTLLVCLLLLTVVPFAATADGSTVQPAADTMPSVLPDGTSVDLSKLWIDWDVTGIESTATVSNGYNKVTAKDKMAWNSTEVKTASWKGASGIMFWVDASEANANVDFILSILVPTGRPKDASGATGWVQFSTAPTVWRSAENGGLLKIGETGYAYAYQNNAWQTFSVSYPSYYLGTGAKLSGWYYVPFESFCYAGASGNGYDVANTGIRNFVDFMTHYEDQRINKISMKSNAVGLKFGDVYYVYSYPDAVDCDKTGTASFVATYDSKEGTDAVGSAANGAITVSGMTGNSATSSANRVWVKLQSSNTTLSGATGLRFWVDTSAMSSEASVQLRLRMLTGKGANTLTDVYAVNKGGYATLAASWTQYVCRADNSVAYYYDQTGAAKPLHVSSTVSGAAEGDLFEALPSGYQGYVYIPFDSFWLSAGSYANMNCAIPFADAVNNNPLMKIALCGVVTGTAADSVTYSDFELVYADTSITGASVSLTNNLNINFYADAQSGATDVRMNFMMGSKNATVDGELQQNGSYRFVCAGLLPQTAVDTVNATLSATINGQMVTQQVEYSIRDYCERMLLNGESSTELKKLLVDLLYYAEAAQNYANYKTDDLATKNLTDVQKLLRSADQTAAITATAGKSGTANAQYGWVSAALRLENTLAVRLKFNAASLENITVDVTVNGRTVTFDDFEGESGVYSLVFNNIGAAEYDSQITAVIKQNGVQIGETLSYSVAAYIGEAAKNAEPGNLAELLRSVYSYGNSAKVYVDEGEAQQ